MKWKTQKEKYAGAGNPNYRGTNTECHYCHKPIRKHPSQLKKTAHVYCSHKCYSLDRINPLSPRSIVRPRMKASEMRGEKHPRWNGIKKFCKVCNKELKGRDKRARGYCSDKCVVKRRKQLKPMYRAMALSAAHSNHKKFKNDICPFCDKTFKRGSRNYRNKFCSRECASQWFSKNKSRENNPLWKGGSSYKDYPPSFNARFRYSIRKRDGFACQHCGVVIKGKWRKGKWLDVHHKDQNKQNSDPSNLISLCRSCHRLEHVRLSRAST